MSITVTEIEGFVVPGDRTVPVFAKFKCNFCIDLRLRKKDFERTRFFFLKPKTDRDTASLKTKK